MSAPHSTLQVDKLAGPGDVRDIVGYIRRSWRSRQWLDLDFSSVVDRQAERVDTTSAEVLANALLGELSQARLRVTLPASEPGLKAFARSGLLFALAQRPQDDTEVFSPGASPEWASLQRWSGRWSPNDREFNTSLRLVPEVGAPDELIQREFVTFLNPHLSVADEDLSKVLTDLHVMPWAQRLVSRVAFGLEESPREELVVAIGRLATELILNIGHAFRRHTGIRGHVAPARQRCYVQVYSTEGGGAESHNRLHFVVADAGHGIVRTLRPKLEVKHKRYAKMPGSEIVGELLADTLPTFGRSSGEGYRSIARTIRDYGGRLRVTTGSRNRDHDLEVVVADLDCGTGPADPVVVFDNDLAFSGTTAHAIVPLQPRARGGASGQ